MNDQPEDAEAKLARLHKSGSRWNAAKAAGVAGAYLVDLFAFAGFPVTSMAATNWLVLTSANQGDAEEVLRACIGTDPKAFEDLKRRVAEGEVDAEEVRRRLTGCERTIREAGRHPDVELRRALGAFAFRCLKEDLDSVTMFEVAEVLARMTALDHFLLQLAVEAPTVKEVEQNAGLAGEWLTARGVPKGKVAETAERHAMQNAPQYQKLLTPHILGFLLKDRFPIPEARIVDAVSRMVRLGLIAVSQDGRQRPHENMWPTELGSTTYRLSLIPPNVEAIREAFERGETV